MKFGVIVITLLLVAIFNVSLAYAQEVEPSAELLGNTTTVDSDEVSAPSPTPISSPVAYDLPYPGILPGHSFYTLKLWRDKIVGFFISSPVKKAEFDLLQADKRVEAGYLLTSKGKNKIDIAEATLAESHKYFDDAITKARDAKKEGMDIHDVTKRLTAANHKYLEVLGEIQQKVGKDDKKLFEKDRLRVLELEKKIKELKP